jgi:Leucine-rich repeat (LRR) protein
MFKNIIELDLSNCGLNELHVETSIGKNIKLLDISNNFITKLPDNFAELFPKLKQLIVTNNMLIQLPYLGENIEELYCVNNNLTSLPVFGEKMKIVFANQNQITNFHFSENIEIMYLRNNLLQELPPLNKKLKHLFCSHNFITKFPQFNENLEILDCSNNRIIRMPKLNNKLIELTCYNNPIHSFSEISENLKGLICFNTPILTFINAEDNSGIEYVNVDDFDGYGYNIVKTNKIRIGSQKLNNFRHMYYSLRFKKQFRRILWKKIRLPKIEKKYSPQNIVNLLDEIGDGDSQAFESLLENL